MTIRTILAFAALGAVAGCSIPNSAPPPPAYLEEYHGYGSPDLAGQQQPDATYLKPPPMVP